MPSVEEYRQSLNGDTRAMIDRLRAIVASAHPDLVERIKWNAPSFGVGEADRITLGVERRGGVRLVLHRGAKPRSTTGLSFSDDEHLAKWPAPDRGVIVWRELADIERDAASLASLCRRWIAATADDLI